MTYFHFCLLTELCVLVLLELQQQRVGESLIKVQGAAAVQHKQASSQLDRGGETHCAVCSVPCAVCSAECGV